MKVDWLKRREKDKLGVRVVCRYISRWKEARMAVTATSKPVRGDEAEPAREKLPLKPQVVRIEVLGDEKVGKTSLICSLVSRHFSEKVPSVLLNVQIPAEESDENVIISITDTSCA